MYGNTCIKLQALPRMCMHGHEDGDDEIIQNVSEGASFIMESVSGTCTYNIIALK